MLVGLVTSASSRVLLTAKPFTVNLLKFAQKKQTLLTYSVVEYVKSHFLPWISNAITITSVLAF